MNYSKLMTVDKLKVKNKVVFLRLDLNVPIIDGKVTSFKRINATLPTLKYLLEQQAKIVILSHFGRPKTKEDLQSGKFSLRTPARELCERLKKLNLMNKFTFIAENKGVKVESEIKLMNPCDVIVLENTRFNDVDINTGEFINLESGNDPQLAKYWSKLCNVYVNDAFGVAHRKHASTYGLGKYTKKNAIGFLMREELKTLSNVVKNPKAPFVVIFGGAKISDKLKAVNAVINNADKVIISGGMAYTFVAAQGFNVGKSMVEESMIPTAKELMKNYKDKICISTDFMCSPSFSDTKPVYRTQEEGMNGLMGLDIGPKSIAAFAEVIKSANTVLWNGPMGVTEFKHYEKGTNDVCEAIAERTKAGAFTVIGGGDSAAAAEKLNKESSFSFISTGGGASLKLIEGSSLDGIASIKSKFFI